MLRDNRRICLPFPLPYILILHLFGKLTLTLTYFLLEVEASVIHCRHQEVYRVSYQFQRRLRCQLLACSFCLYPFLFALYCVDCSVCIDGYAKSTGFTCTKCDENVRGIAVATIFLVISMVIIFTAMKYLMSVGMGARRGIIARIIRRVPLQSVKIIIVAWQILTQVRHRLVLKRISHHNHLKF